MISEENKILYKKAVEKFGISGQMLMAIQEMSELTKELTNHILCRFDRLEDLPAEIADVEIMLEQLKIMFLLESVVEMKKDNTRFVAVMYSILDLEPVA